MRDYLSIVLKEAKFPIVIRKHDCRTVEKIKIHSSNPFNGATLGLEVKCNYEAEKVVYV